jgi:lipopolysaccharide/colanic/teichoic acid biosynthesis glycosyltransferase
MGSKISLNNLEKTDVLKEILKPENKLSSVVKRLLDIFFSLLGLLFFFLLLPIIAVLIKIDFRAPVFYCQKRVGKDRRIFTLCKFRTMKDDPNQHKKLWREKEEKNVTHVGKFLRKLHLDELPQFWNILKGEMSFIGPRPEWIELAKIFEKEIPFYNYRYLVKPGFTGWAQINFPASRSLEEAKEKFEYDLYYIKNRSLALDIKIILKTMHIFKF